MNRGAVVRGVGPDMVLATVLVIALGVGTVLLLGGQQGSSVELAAVGGVLALIGLVLLLASGWTEPLTLLAITLPLPALYSSSDVRLSPALLLTTAIVCAWLLRVGVHGRRTVAGPFPVRVVTLLVGAVLLSAAFSQYRLAALQELANIAVIFGLLVVAWDELQRSSDRVHALALVLTSVAAVSGPVAVAQAMGALPSPFPLWNTSFHRAALGFGQPNGAGVFFALSLPFAVYAVRVAPPGTARLTRVLALAAALLGLAATFSRGSWVAVLASPAVLLLTGESRASLRFWILTFLLVVLFDVVTGGALRGRVMGIWEDPGVEQRAALMLAAFLMFQANPVVGVGPGGFEPSLADFGPQISWLWDYVGSVHNAYLHTAAEWGVIGLLAFLAFMGTTLWTLFRSVREGRRDALLSPRERMQRETVLWAFTAACLVAVFEWPFAHGFGQLIMLTVAMGFALAPTRGTQGVGEPVSGDAHAASAWTASPREGALS